VHSTYHYGYFALAKIINMIFKDKLNNDFTWAIILQKKDELTRADVLGIIETHKINSI